MGKGDVATRSKSQKSPAIQVCMVNLEVQLAKKNWNYKSNYWHPLTLSFFFQNEQSTPANPPTAYPDWSQFQVCKMKLCCIAFLLI
jgi:plant G-box-binding factor